MRLTDELQIDLPWPPSVNHYWRHVGSKVLISARGRLYRDSVSVAVYVANRKMNPGRYAVAIEACPPDRRKRDLDNMLKSTLDALAHAGVYDDDGSIDSLTIVRCPMVENGLLKVKVSLIPANTQG